MMSINTDHDELLEAYTPCMLQCIEIENIWSNCYG